MSTAEQVRSDDPSPSAADGKHSSAYDISSLLLTTLSNIFVCAAHDRPQIISPSAGTIEEQRSKRAISGLSVTTSPQTNRLHKGTATPVPLLVLLLKRYANVNVLLDSR